MASMNLLRALATVSGMTLLSRILGFVRDFVQARAFGAGIYDLPGLVANLNSQNSTTPDNQPWTEANYAAVMKTLGY